jgi:5-methylcytosine-specific restriction enzyme A
MTANRVIAGWCRYYQYTSRPSQQFSRLGFLTFWLAAHWLARKYRRSIRSTIIRFKGTKETFDHDGQRLMNHTFFKRQIYPARARPFPNPYLAGPITREELLDDSPANAGYETRPGWADIRITIIKRDNFTCQWPGCGVKVTPGTCEVDHIRPRHVFGWKPDADKPENLWTLCQEHHEIKTRNDRERESRVR